VSVSELKETVARLSKTERLQMMEVLWEEIRKDEPPSPASHGDVLAQRLAKAESGKAEFMTIPELKKRLGR